MRSGARAVEALEKVGLGDQLDKAPNQMSGGQMQRVAIARAIVNNPDILLADEPTGALDSETSVQIMNLLQEIAKDKLIIMVTHNPDLASKYATRTVRLLDGRIVGDDNPCTESETSAPVTVKVKEHTSMSFATAMSLSLHNLMTKKGAHPAHGVCGLDRHHRYRAHPLALARLPVLHQHRAGADALVLPADDRGKPRGYVRDAHGHDGREGRRKGNT